MNKISKELITLITMLLITTITPQDCSCPSNVPAAPGTLSDNLNFIPISEIADGVNYGVPVVLGGLIFLQNDFQVDESIESIDAHCPTGFRVPTADEMSQVIFSVGTGAFLKLTSLTGLNLQLDYSYLTSTKSFPDKFDSTDNDSWNFKGVYVDSLMKAITMEDINTYWEPYKAVKCVMDKTLPIGGRTADMYVNQSYVFTAQRQNLVSQVWQYDTQVYTSSTVTVNSATPGCHLLQAWGKNLLNEVLYSCKTVFVVQPFGSDGASTLTTTTVSNQNLGIKAQPNNSLFFSPSISPIAPKLNGGLYLSYVDLNDKTCHIIEFDQNMVKLSNTNLGLTIVPMDIVATSWGFVIFARESADTNNGFLIAFNSDYTQRWKRTLQNNGPIPNVVNQQISFYDPNGNVLDGNNLNFAIGNGKLQYARGRISLVYGRYNHFGMNADGTRNDHTGDGYLTFDENGQDEKYSWIWQASHSLYQTHIYTGEYYATAALGDDYPQNIQVCMVDQSSVDGYIDGVRQRAVRHPKWCTNIVTAGSIPGDGKGNTCGRLGGLHYLNGTFGLIYQRKPCKLTNVSSGSTVSTTYNELSLVTFKFNSSTKTFTNITKKVLVTTTDLIMSVRSGKYGNKIFISYASQKTSNGLNTSNNNYYLGTETTKYMLVGFDGVIATQPFLATLNSTPLSDEMKYLNDGRLVWSFIDFNQNLFIYYTSPPPFVQNTSFVELHEKAKESKLHKLISKKFLSHT
jgi:hypothetical protein